MDTQQLLNASVLDIIFEGKNKEYGAYCLRKEYNGRLKKAMISTGTFVGLIILMLSFKGKDEAINFEPVINSSVELKKVDPADLPVIIPPKPAAPPPIVKTVQFTSPPKIVSDKDVNPDDRPPENNTLDNVKIDVFTQDGPVIGDNIVPPEGTSNGVIGIVIDNRTDEEKIFTGVEIESSYPGGPKAWARFLNKTFVYPQNAVDNRIQGTVIIRFIVDQSGNASNVEAIAGPDELKAEAIRVIKKSGKWNPAIQNGRIVKSYKQQPVVFKLMDE